MCRPRSAALGQADAHLNPKLESQIIQDMTCIIANCVCPVPIGPRLLVAQLLACRSCNNCNANPLRPLISLNQYSFTLQDLQAQADAMTSADQLEVQMQFQDHSFMNLNNSQARMPLNV